MQENVVVSCRYRTLLYFFLAAMRHDKDAVRNLLECGASPDIQCGWHDNSVLDETLSACQNIDIVNTLEIAKMLILAGVKKTDKSKEYVHKIGEQFEFFRSDFNAELVEEFGAALSELYELFDVEPVPRRVVYDGKSKITVKSHTWQEQHSELWNMLVPGKGAANTVQGELIRIIGRVLHEILDNGGMNWDEKTLYRLNELTVMWVLANPDPIELKKVDYKR